MIQCANCKTRKRQMDRREKTEIDAELLNQYTMKSPSIFKNKGKLYTFSTSGHWLTVKGKSSNYYV